MSTTLYQRSCVATVDTVRMEGLRCVFKAVKTLKKEPNSLDLKIYNLKPETRASIQKKGVPVVLSAGYTGTAAVIFSGDVRTVDHVRDGADWVTHIQCGDGERAYLYQRLSKSFKSGTSVMDVVSAAAQALGISTGNLSSQLAAGGFRDGLTQFVGGYAARGTASDHLDRVLKGLGFAWSVQDGALVLLKQGDVLPGQAILLTPDSGLIGSPEHGAPDKKGGPSSLKVKTLLQPQVRCGGQVQIQSLTVKGAFRVEKIEHEGDTMGGNWYTELQLKPL